MDQNKDAPNAPTALDIAETTKPAAEVSDPAQTVESTAQEPITVSVDHAAPEAEQASVEVQPINLQVQTFPVPVSDDTTTATHSVVAEIEDFLKFFGDNIDHRFHALIAKLRATL